MTHTRPQPKRRMAIEPFLTPAELCERWSVCKATITNMVQRGELLAMRVGRQLRIKETEVVRYERFGPRRTAA